MLTTTSDIRSVPDRAFDGKSPHGFPHTAAEPATAAPQYLSECSPKDRPWDQHRSQADDVAAIFAGAGGVWFSRLGQRVELCSLVLGFCWSPDRTDSEALTLKLREAHFCRVRHCPICQWRRSLMWIARFLQVIPEVLGKYPKGRFIFLTLTQRNVPVNELRVTLRAMGKGIERLIRRQIESQTLAETYSVIFDQYAEQVGHECYAALVRARLPARLDAAKDRIGEISCDDALVQAMQAEVIRRENCDPAPAMARVRNHLAELRDKLDFVQPLADEIDRRTAEFTRRSLARSRYLQEVIGERRGQIKDFFEKINGAMQGRRLNDLRELESMPPLLLPSAKLLAGRDSLYEPPHRRSSEENAPVEDAVTDSMRQDALAQLGGAMRNSLTVARANRLAARLPGGKGARIASADLPIETEHDIEDLLALLLHAEASAARYRIETTEEDHSQKDRKLAYQFDRFFVIKK